MWCMRPRFSYDEIIKKFSYIIGSRPQINQAISCNSKFCTENRWIQKKNLNFYGYFDYFLLWSIKYPLEVRIGSLRRGGCMRDEVDLKQWTKIVASGLHLHLLSSIVLVILKYKDGWLQDAQLGPN